MFHVLKKQTRSTKSCHQGSTGHMWEECTVTWRRLLKLFNAAELQISLQRSQFGIFKGCGLMNVFKKVITSHNNHI